MQPKPETIPTAATDRAPILTLTSLVKTFGTYMAVDGIDLAVADGEFLTIVGPSGCGKTTLLRMLAGLELPSSGEIALRGEAINDLPPNRRPTCLVFQSLALFPHRSVGENIAFPMKMKRIAPAQRRARVEELMALMRLPPHYTDRNVMRCSGGERQRVALARAFAYDPDILFFDEPLSALDYKLRKEAGEGTEGHPQGNRQDLHLHHPQPGRGHGDVRPDCGDAVGQDAAGWHARGNLHPPAKPLRRRVHGRGERLSGAPRRGRAV